MNYEGIARARLCTACKQPIHRCSCQQNKYHVFGLQRGSIGDLVSMGVYAASKRDAASTARCLWPGMTVQRVIRVQG